MTLPWLDTDGKPFHLVPGCSGTVRARGDEFEVVVTFPDGEERVLPKRYPTIEEARTLNTRLLVRVPR